MAGMFDGGLMQTVTGPGGVLSKFTGSGGILSQQTGILQARIAAFKAGASPQAKLQALTATLGTRLRQPGGLLAGLRGPAASAPPPAAVTPAAGAQRLDSYATGAQVAVSLIPPPKAARFT